MNTTSKSTNGNQVINTFSTAVTVIDTSRLAQHSKLLTSEVNLGMPLWSVQAIKTHNLITCQYHHVWPPS